MTIKLMMRRQQSVPICIAILIVVSALTLATAKLAHTPSVRVSTLSSIGRHGPQIEAGDATDTTTQHRDSDYYQHNIRAGIFGAPIPAPPTPAPHNVVVTVRPALQEVVDPLTSYILRGVGTADDGKWALLEDRKTRKGWYLQEGDLFHDFHVVEIGPKSLTLSLNGVTRTLDLSDADVTSGSVKVADAGTSTDTPQQLILSQIRNISLNYMAVTQTLSPEQINHLKDEVFEGRMSLDDYNKRVGTQNTTGVLYINNDNELRTITNADNTITLSIGGD